MDAGLPKKEWNRKKMPLPDPAAAAPAVKELARLLRACLKINYLSLG